LRRHTPAPAPTKSHGSNSQCGNPQASRTPGHLRRNRSAHGSIANQRQPPSNAPRNGHRRFFQRPWRAPSGSMREAIVPDAHRHSRPPGTCTICNERLAPAGRPVSAPLASRGRKGESLTGSGRPGCDHQEAACPVTVPLSVPRPVFIISASVGIRLRFSDLTPR